MNSFYIEDTLGVAIRTIPWNGISKLPYYITDSYDFRKADINGVHCLFMKPRATLDTLSSVKKHISRVRETETLPVVLDLDSMIARQRKALVEARIPFVVMGCQVYLPFLGVALSERYTSARTPGRTLLPSSQLLLFYYMYQSELELKTKCAADLLGISAMQITRAVKQLTSLGLLAVRKDGVMNIVSGNKNRQDLFLAAKPYLLNPVRKKVYSENTELPAGLPLSGFSALSELTMLGGSATETYAYYGKIGQIVSVDTLVDNTVQVEVEIWRYDPMLLSNHSGVVDVLSLIASLTTPLSASNDPRVEQAVDELLSELWGRNNQWSVE